MSLVVRMVVVLLLGVLVAVAGWWWQARDAGSPAPETRVVRGATVFEFADHEPVTSEVRAFSLAPVATGHTAGPLTLITHGFVVAPLETSQAAFQEQLCEQGSLHRAALLNVVATDPVLVSAIAALDPPQHQDGRRTCVRLEGISQRLVSLTHQGQDYPPAWADDNQTGTDPARYLLLEHIERIACDSP